MRQISSDPFARTTLHRRKVSAETVTHAGCAWCGSVKVSKDGLRAYLYEYVEGRDSARGGSDWTISGRFCCIDCARTYHQGRF
jgi:hypothetical protein